VSAFFFFLFLRLFFGVAFLPAPHPLTRFFSVLFLFFSRPGGGVHDWHSGPVDAGAYLDARCLAPIFRFSFSFSSFFHFIFQSFSSFHLSIIFISISFSFQLSFIFIFVDVRGCYILYARRVASRNLGVVVVVGVTQEDARALEPANRCRARVASWGVVDVVAFRNSAFFWRWDRPFISRWCSLVVVVLVVVVVVVVHISRGAGQASRPRWTRTRTRTSGPPVRVRVRVRLWWQRG
jgi:hypothetical protein